MQYLVVDRIEDGYAVCEGENSATVNIALLLLPDGVEEGSVLELAPDGGFAINSDLQQKRKAEMLSLQNDIFE